MIAIVEHAARRPRRCGIGRALQAAVLACMALLIAGCSPSYESPLVVGTNAWPGYHPLHLARDLGYLDGLSLRLVELGSNTQAMDALRVGNLDLAGLTLDEVLTLLQEGVPLKVIWVMNISAGADAIVARPGIKHMTDLRGRRIGVEQTAVGAYMLQGALEQAGMQVSEVIVVPLPLDEHEAAWREQSVDALVTFDPVRQALLNEGGHVIFDSRALPGEIVDVLVVRESILQCCAPRVAGLVDGQRRALTYIEQHRDDAMSRMAKHFGISAADMSAAFDGMILPDHAANHQLLSGPSPGLYTTVQRLAHVMKERGLLMQIPGTSALLDGRFTGETSEIKP
ncbi:ABC transporter substrate-binding protein [Azonexus sp.]|uniref:ABC transporter substrate-binding protein n=1 Tax=Azonexus sp. TaxID=1872668 RepID=UPI0028176696|nr:ABC transporter substrate-binding protein [Azonexus sp.]MDR1994804.1 ABC transporter substrate-binding protein [Azonexus sp.]